MNLLIKSQSALRENADENGDSAERAAPGAAVGLEIDPELAVVVAAWDGLMPAIKAAILVLARI